MSNWNSSDKTAITLSNSNFTATSTGTGGVRSTTSRKPSDGGKYYFEFTNILMTSSNDGIGFANASWVLTASSNSFDICSHVTFGAVRDGSGGSISYADGDPSGHTLSVALDFDNGHMWWRIDGNNWNNSGTANPATNTGGNVAAMIAHSSTTPLFLAAALVVSGDHVTMNGGSNGAFAQSIPSGFVQWDPASNTFDVTEAADTASFIGYPGVPGVTGQLLVTENTDTFAAAGYPALVFSVTLVESKDSFSAFIIQPKTGTMAATEAKDIFAGVGVGYGENLAFDLTEAPDKFAAVGTSFQPVSGPLTATEFADSFRALGAGATVSVNRPVFFVT